MPRTDPRKPAHETRIRPARSSDGEAVADVWLASFRATYDFPPAHYEHEVRRWVADKMLPEHETWVVEVVSGDAHEIVAVMALTEIAVDQLYVAPGWTGQGIGGRCLALAKERRPRGLELWTFQANLGARRFYERHGFVAVEFGDGSDNVERQPDVRYAWRP